MPYPDLSEDERRTLVLGLANLGLELPQWSGWLRDVASKLDGCEEFDEWYRFANGCNDARSRRATLTTLLARIGNGQEENKSGPSS